MVSYWNQPRSVKQSLSGGGLAGGWEWGQPGSLSSQMPGNMFIWDNHLWSACLSSQSSSQALKL